MDVGPVIPKSASSLTLVMGSTGNLAHQVAAGAPADVFFAANEAFVDDLIERGGLLRETRALYAQGRIGVAARPGAEDGSAGCLPGDCTAPSRCC